MCGPEPVSDKKERLPALIENGPPKILIPMGRTAPMFPHKIERVYSIESFRFCSVSGLEGVG